MEQKEFNRKIAELIPRPDPDTTARLFQFDKECAEFAAPDILTALGFIARNFDQDTLQGTYEIISHGKAALPSEMIAAAVFLQNGDTPQHMSQLACSGGLMCFYAPKVPEESSPLAICSVMEGGVECTFYTEWFDVFKPDTAFQCAQEYAARKKIPVTQALRLLNADMEFDESIGCRSILDGDNREMTRALFTIFKRCPAVAAHITFHVDRGEVVVEPNPLWLDLKKAVTPNMTKQDDLSSEKLDNDQLKISEMEQYRPYVISSREGYSSRLVLFRDADTFYYGNSWTEDGVTRYSEMPGGDCQLLARKLVYIAPGRTMRDVCEEFLSLYMDWADRGVPTPPGFFVFGLDLSPYEFIRLNFPDTPSQERIDEVKDELCVPFKGMALGDAADALQEELDRRSAGKPPSVDLEMYSDMEIVGVLLDVTGCTG